MMLPMWIWISAAFFTGFASLAVLQLVVHARKIIVRWLHLSLWQAAIIGGPVVATVLYATFALAQETLHRIDPVIFAALQMAVLLPVALVFLWISRSTLTFKLLCQGALGGLILGGGFIGLAITLRNVGIVRAACLTGVDGIMASLIVQIAHRKRQPLFIVLAGICAGAGATLLWFMAPMQWQADVFALVVGLCFGMYALYVEQAGVLQREFRSAWAFFGILLTIMAVAAALVAACFGAWPSLMTVSVTDLEIILYTSLATILTPILLLTLLHRYHSPVTLALLAVLEPLTSIAFAYALGFASLGLVGWSGVGLIVLSMLLQAVSAKRARAHKSADVRVATVFYDEQATCPLPEHIQADDGMIKTTDETFLALLGQLTGKGSQKSVWLDQRRDGKGQNLERSDEYTSKEHRDTEDLLSEPLLLELSASEEVYVMKGEEHINV